MFSDLATVMVFISAVINLAASGDSLFGMDEYFSFILQLLKEDKNFRPFLERKSD